MSRPKSYPPVKGMSIKALKDILYREQIEESQASMDEWEEIKQMQIDAVKESHLSNDVLKKYRPSSAYLNSRDYPTYKVEQERIISVDDGLFIMFEALIPYIIIWIAVIYSALYIY